MKSKKLNLNNLTVKSFTTSKQEEVSGGAKGFLSIGKHCTHAHNTCYGTGQTDALFCGDATH